MEKYNEKHDISIQDMENEIHRIEQQIQADINELKEFEDFTPLVAEFSAGSLESELESYVHYMQNPPADSLEKCFSSTVGENSQDQALDQQIKELELAIEEAREEAFGDLESVNTDSPSEIDHLHGLINEIKGKIRQATAEKQNLQDLMDRESEEQKSFQSNLELVTNELKKKILATNTANTKMRIDGEMLAHELEMLQMRLTRKKGIATRIVSEGPARNTQ